MASSAAASASAFPQHTCPCCAWFGNIALPGRPEPQCYRERLAPDFQNLGIGLVVCRGQYFVVGNDGEPSTIPEALENGLLEEALAMLRPFVGAYTFYQQLQAACNLWQGVFHDLPLSHSEFLARFNTPREGGLRYHPAFGEMLERFDPRNRFDRLTIAQQGQLREMCSASGQEVFDYINSVPAGDGDYDPLASSF
jgi:hypothetical protein